MTAGAWTDEQRGIIEARDRPILVSAGPGSGKTRTLVGKFLALVDEGTPPERILALTFSKKAAVEIQQRLEVQTRRSHTGLWISTFHSFGYALVDRFRVEASIPRSFRLLTGFKEWVLLRDVLERTQPSSALATAVRHRGLVAHVAGAIGALKQGLVTPDQLEGSLAKLDQNAARDLPLLEDLVKVYRAYEDELRARRHFDYRDLIWRARQLIADSAEIRERVRSWFDAVLLDEIQDIDPAQLELVHGVAADGPLSRQITAFGDLNQSIYGFRGAFPQETAARFRAAFPATEEMTLSRNFRAHRTLVQVAGRVIESPMDGAGKTEAPAPQLEVIEAPTSLAEATAVARALARAHREGNRWDGMAVLCRSLKRDARAIEIELQRLGIPYRVQGNSSFYRNPAVAYLVNYLLALSAKRDENEDGPLRRVLASPVAGLPQTALARFLDRVVRRNRHAGRYLWYLRFLMERADPERFPVWRPDIADEEEAATEIAREQERYAESRPPYFFELMTDDDRQAFYDFHQRFLFLRARARRARDALPALVAAVATRSGLTPWILRLADRDSRLAERHAANVTKLHQMVIDFTEIAREDRGEPPVLADLARHLRQLLEHFSNESEVDAPAEAFYAPVDAVTVMTVHQAKGLEFDVVAVPHLVVGRFPAPPKPGIVLSRAAASALERLHAMYRDPTQAEATEHYAEERRLAYVALTRARQRSILSWAHRYDEEESESAPSPFLVEALGGDERTFWAEVQDRGIAPGERLDELSSGLAGVDYVSTDEALRLEDVRSTDEVDIVLRQAFQRGTDELRRLVRERVEASPVEIDWAFVSGGEVFAAEPARPLALDPARIVLSASRLSDYRSCPRKFYYAKLLHLEPWSRSWAVFGTLVHEVMEHFHTDHPDKQAFTGAALPRLRAELLGRFQEALRERADQFGTEFELERQLATLDVMVDRYLELQRHEPLRYVSGREVELRFGASGQVRMMAKIDRVVTDTPELADATEILIADYKTVRYRPMDKARTLCGRVKKGSELQLATYHRALRLGSGLDASYLGLIYLRHASAWRAGTLAPLLRVMEKSAARASGEWWGIDGDRKWTDRSFVTPDELDVAWDQIESMAADVLDGARRAFDITPGSHCRWCDFAAICGKE